jgi:glyoxalase family protein
MQTSVHGLHHVTAIAGDPQVNFEFYSGVMGMRLVKKSVNQDVPDTYHLFYADSVGTPGTDLTFFPWPDMEPARLGVGFAVEVAFVVRKDSLPYWQERFKKEGVSFDTIETRFGEQVLPFRDPHGLRLSLVETDSERPCVPWTDSPVPPEHQLRGMHSVRLWERDRRFTEVLLTQVMGFKSIGMENDWYRYGVEAGGSGQIVEIKEMPAKRERLGQWGTGGVHHVAWRVKDENEQMAVRGQLEAVGLHPTEQIDRFWFRSVYFREPGGTLFELATDGPGFDRDEDQAHLGERLILPPWFEPHRAQIEAALPPLSSPTIKS